jgi:hypothetical protein
MNDYTPTTEEVRGTYATYGFSDCHRHVGETDHQAIDAFHAEFDRWLAAHDADTREQCAREIEKLTDKGVARTVDRITDPLPSDWKAVGVDEGLRRAAQVLREGGQK